MDYHSDRFTDRSLVACDRSGRIVAALPANIGGDTLHSHQGLTYGGWILPKRHFSLMSMLELWDSSLELMRQSGIMRLVYKPVPHIYHTMPAEEDLYALFRSGARLESRLMTSAVDLTSPVEYSKNTIRRLKNENKTAINTPIHLSSFWSILEHLLSKKYNTHPTHTLEEITKLRERFPDNIILVTVEDGGEILAGALFYRTRGVMHLQYAASTSRGREENVFPKLYRHVMDHLCDGCRYLDFGTSAAPSASGINEGLIQQKYSLGGRAVVCDTYTLKL